MRIILVVIAILLALLQPASQAVISSSAPTYLQDLPPVLRLILEQEMWKLRPITTSPAPVYDYLT